MKTIVETERLRIRQMADGDYENLYRLDSDSEVMKYVNGGIPMDGEAVRATLSRILARYEEFPGYGIWAAEVRGSGEFIGWFALKNLPGTSEIEIGYRLLPRHWGKGFATEGSLKLMDYGFKDLGLKKIVAIANPENAASKRVLEKIGLKYTGDIEYQSILAPRKIQVSWFELISPS